MSSAIRLAPCATLVILLASAPACVDPDQRLQDFTDRVIDASAGADSLGVVADISGQQLLAISTPVNRSSLIRFITTVEFTMVGDGGTADFSFQPIVYDPCTAGTEGDGGIPVGDPIVVDGVSISSGGTFEIALDDTAVPAEANAVSCSPIIADFELTAAIKSADEVCGNVDGMVKSPFMQSINGSTFGAIRIETGTTGDADLPAAEYKCP